MGEKEILDSFFEEEFIMRLLDFSKKTVQNLRSDGSDQIPPHVKLGSRYIYPKSGFEKWAKHNGLSFDLRLNR